MNNFAPSFEGNIQLRAILPEDELFSYSVYASTRESEMALVSWTGEQKAAFLRMQYEAQKAHYAAYFPSAQVFVIELANIPAGRMILNETGEDFLLIDIALLPEYRSQGIGSQLLQDLQQHAGQASKPIRLHVEIFNPAARLYERLGFRKTAESGIYEEMVWEGPYHGERDLAR